MKLVRYTTDTTTGIGALEGDDTVRSTPWSTFEEIFAEEDPLAAVSRADLSSCPIVENPTLAAPTVHRAQIIGTGGNYADHSEESSTIATFAEPIFFPFLVGATIGPDENIVIPTPSTLTDYEVEFSVVIGRTARRLTEDNAMDHVFGYTIVNDVSAREVSVRERMQIMLSKSPDTFVPVGPCVVTRDEIADPHALSISTRLNGAVRQEALTGDMTVRIPALLAFLTQTITLYPGDIITTGTPGGVGFFREPQEFMQDGDEIVVEVEGVGRLRNRVVKGW